MAMIRSTSGTDAAARRTIPSSAGCISRMSTTVAWSLIVRSLRRLRARRHGQRTGPPREPDGLDLGMHAELGKHVLHVTLHGHDADRERLSTTSCVVCPSARRASTSRSRRVRESNLAPSTESKRETRTSSTRAPGASPEGSARRRRLVGGDPELARSSSVRAITPGGAGGDHGRRPPPDRVPRSPPGSGRRRARLQRRGGSGPRARRAPPRARQRGSSEAAAGPRSRCGPVRGRTRRSGDRPGEVVREAQPPLQHQARERSCSSPRRCIGTGATFLKGETGGMASRDQSAREETSPYLLATCDQPGRLVPLGRRGVRRGSRARRPDLPVGRVRGLPLVPRDGAGVLRRCRQTAAFLSEHFVSIKVDREERPDIDAIYMDAVQAMTGSGGWPMSRLPHPGRPTLLCRHLLPRRAPPRDAVVPAGPRRHHRRLAHRRADVEAQGGPSSRRSRARRPGPERSRPIDATLVDEAFARIERRVRR